MKKLLAALMIMMMPTFAMALESLSGVEDLVEKTKSGTSAVVFTIESQDSSWTQYKASIEQYEKTNKDVKFFLASLENPEFMQMAMMLGISALPTTLFSQDGEVMTGAAGAASLETLQQIVPKVQEAIKKELERRASEQKPPAPQEQKQEETIDYRPRKGITSKVTKIA